MVQSIHYFLKMNEWEQKKKKLDQSKTKTQQGKRQTL